jgi:hypothetical protein
MINIELKTSQLLMVLKVRLYRFEVICGFKMIEDGRPGEGPANRVGIF